MIICGIKLTHDGGVAVLDNGTLAFSTEMEKLSNNDRYQALDDLARIPQLLGAFGYRMSDVDVFAVDGWDGPGHARIETCNDGLAAFVDAAGYLEPDGEVLTPLTGGALDIAGESFAFESYAHVAGHVAAAWCTSPFARNAAPCLCLVWDGAIFPRLYSIDPAHGGIRFRENLCHLIGHAYAMAGQHFGPYRREHRGWRHGDLGIAGKMMAYIGLGTPDDAIQAVFRQQYEYYFESGWNAARNYRDTVEGHGTTCEPSLDHLHAYFADCRERLRGREDAEILASFHVFVEKLLLERLAAFIARNPDAPQALCFTGGCALNIKWNSAIRQSGLFDAIWIPPFPNDSGGAIGTACCAHIRREGLKPVTWDVFRGPPLGAAATPAGWTSRPCDAEDLALLLLDGQMVIFLDGRAELGPRALGHRSIFASAESMVMKDLLNDAKQREFYRPVAPICLEDRAAEIFDPGTTDPFMLYEHRVRDKWANAIPAVIHLDGTARLQTVARDPSDPVAAVLIAMEKYSGAPLLCNTSANFSGCGFFPDVESAARWGKIPHIWSEGLLYTGPGAAMRTEEKTAVRQLSFHE